MKQVQDRTRLRREYLRRKRQAQAKVLIGTTFGTVMGLATIAVLFLLCMVLTFSPYWDDEGVETPKEELLRVAKE